MENCLWYVPLGCMGGEWIGVNSADEARNYLCRRVKDFSMSSDPVSDLVAINQVTGETLAGNHRPFRGGSDALQEK